MYSRSVKFNGITTSPSRPPTLRNITSYVTSANVERKFLNVSHTRRSMTSHMMWYYPWGGVGQFFLGESQSSIYPNMCAKFGCAPTVVSKREEVQTDRQMDNAALYSRLGPRLYHIYIYILLSLAVFEVLSTIYQQQVQTIIVALAGYPDSLGFPPSLQPSLTASLPPPFAALHLSVKFNGITSARQADRQHYVI